MKSFNLIKGGNKGKLVKILMMNTEFSFDNFRNEDDLPFFSSLPDEDNSERKLDLSSENTFCLSSDKSYNSQDYSPCKKNINEYVLSESFTEDVDQVPFSGKIPDLNALAEIVREQISERGVEHVIEKCLDIEFEDEPQPLMRKMVRKSPRQIRELRRAFRITPEWNRKFEEKLAKIVGLTRAQVHKWHFDERKRTSQK